LTTLLAPGLGLGFFFFFVVVVVVVTSASDAPSVASGLIVAESRDSPLAMRRSH
jgi:hypothetical protein